MLSIPIDNGEVNWERRAIVSAAMCRATGMTLDECLSHIINNEEFKLLVIKAWEDGADRLKERDASI